MLLKIWVLVILSCTMLLLTGCNKTVKTDDKETAIDNDVGSSTSSKENTKAEDDNSSALSKDETTSGSGMEWPKGMTEEIPELDKGKLKNAENLGNSYAVSITGVTADDVKDYIEKVKAAGYDLESYSTTNPDTEEFDFYATNKDGDDFYLNYYPQDEKVNITLMIIAE